MPSAPIVRGDLMGLHGASASEQTASGELMKHRQISRLHTRRAR